VPNNKALVGLGGGGLVNLVGSKSVVSTYKTGLITTNNNGLIPVPSNKLILTKREIVTVNDGGEIVVTKPVPPVPVTNLPTVIVPPFEIPSFNVPPFGSVTPIGGFPPFSFTKPVSKSGGGGFGGRDKGAYSGKRATNYTPNVYSIAMGFRANKPVKQTLFSGGEIKPVIGAKPKPFKFGLPKVKKKLKWRMPKIL
jgi:hypothetical protein